MTPRSTLLVDAGGAHYAIRADYTEIAFAWEASGRPLVPWNFWYFPFAPKDPELSAWAGSELQPLAKASNESWLYRATLAVALKDPELAAGFRVGRSYAGRACPTGDWELL